MIYRLIFLNGARRGQQITVPREPLTVGRGAQCGLQIDDPEMAHVHACVEHRATGLVIRDLGTMNKILVNHTEVSEARLRHGDVVEIGRTRLLVQALVQAEVYTSPAIVAARRRRRVAVTVAVVGAITGVILAALKIFPSPKAESAGKALVGSERISPPDGPPPEVISFTEAMHAVGPVTVPERSPGGGFTATVSRAVQDPMEVPEEPPMPPMVAELQRGSGAASESRTLPIGGADTEELLRRKVDEMLDRARRLAETGAWTESEALLTSLERIMPEYLPPYLERARLLTQRGMVEPALRQCDEILKRDAETPILAEARSLRARLLQAQRQVLPEFGGRIRIASSEQTRFPAAPDFGEVRSVSVVLRPGARAGPIEASAVRVDLRFFERDPATGRIRPSPVSSPGSGLTLAGPWLLGEEKVVTATYRRPANPDRGGWSGAQFFGYIVRVYYFGALQDEWAQPSRLLHQGHDPAAALAPPVGEESNRRDPGSAQS